MEHWYAVHTKPRKECQVRDYLQSRGIEIYLPEITVRGEGLRAKRRLQPFFARYLFARLDPVRVPLSLINWAPGVTSMVTFGLQPAPLRDEVIDWLKERIALMEAEAARKDQPLRHNDRLRVTSGPLRGMEAIFDRRLSGEGRARILVQLLDRLVACEISEEWLERIG